MSKTWGRVEMGNQQPKEQVQDKTVADSKPGEDEDPSVSLKQKGAQA